MSVPSTLFTGGLVFDGEHSPRPGLGVLVADGRIAALAPAATFDGFAGPRVDTGGCTLMPGLIDAHVHLAMEATGDVVTTLRQRPAADLTLRMLENAQASLCGGITAARDLGGVEWAEVAVRNAIRAGRHLGPDLRCAGKVLTITGGHGAWIGQECDGPEAYTRGVRLNVKNGADCIKLIATGGVLTGGVDPLAPHPSTEEMAAAVRMARDFGIRVAAHAQGVRGIRRALDAGVDSIEHGFELPDDVIATMIERGTCLVGTLASMMSLVAMLDGLPAYVREKVERFSALHFDSFRRYVKAGGRVALGTDAGTPGNHHGANAVELRHMVDLGMTPLDALRAGTCIAADLLDLPDHGRIAPGAAADLLLVPGNPVEDIGAAADCRRHRGLWKGGVDVHAALRHPSAVRRQFAAAPTLAAAAGF
ncbi:metal-dependent hydrolase family protein [Oleisolibacter albus]|uniref:metal-dependent hydrolase family protein n=1 Tax=Oleisolibacter albus TaxID=2171757 RepID=UPI000DF47E2A|nr:amidohydrolase family protein [Oleisolibacter albus]